MHKWWDIFIEQNKTTGSRKATHWFEIERPWSMKENKTNSRLGYTLQTNNSGTRGACQPVEHLAFLELLSNSPHTPVTRVPGSPTAPAHHRTCLFKHMSGCVLINILKHTHTYHVALRILSSCCLQVESKFTVILFLIPVNWH